MTQLPIQKCKKETTEEKLIRFEKEFNKKIQKDPEFKKQINRINNSFRIFSQNYKDQVDAISLDKQIIKISEELDVGIDFIKEESSKKNIDALREETNKNFNILREELKKNINTHKEETKKIENKSSMGVEVTETGNFYYKNKKLCIGTNSNAGKFFKYSLEDKNHFVPDSFCINELKSEQIKNIRRDVNDKFIKKDGIKAIYKRSGDGAGYILLSIIELGSL